MLEPCQGVPPGPVTLIPILHHYVWSSASACQCRHVSTSTTSRNTSKNTVALIICFIQPTEQEDMAYPTVCTLYIWIYVDYFMCVGPHVYQYPK